MAAKVTGEGPLHLDADEADALRAVVKKLLGQVTELQGLNIAMVAGLFRRRLQVIHEEHADGTISFDLAPAPPDPLEETPATVN